ncbi:MAG: class I SAM-dependent methyltransferase [Candidatus Liptonbacteria bacterium]|nr:class I SAM-dependent methyltransferase [Candidatus Liptonbacteria bacterium]
MAPLPPEKIEDLKEDNVFSASLREHSLTFHATWGLFSPTAVDEGSRLLIEEMEIRPTDAILDVGCGYGVLGLFAAALAPQGTVDLVDKDFVAVNYAKKNASKNRLAHATAYLSNLLSHVAPDKKFDVILSNPPAQGGRELLSIFLHDAKTHLKPGGKIYLVTVSGLKEFVKRNFQEVFGNYEKVRQGKTYTVALARNGIMHNS